MILDASLKRSQKIDRYEFVKSKQKGFFKFADSKYGIAYVLVPLFVLCSIFALFTSVSQWTYGVPIVFILVSIWPIREWKEEKVEKLRMKWFHQLDKKVRDSILERQETIFKKMIT